MTTRFAETVAHTAATALDVEIVITLPALASALKVSLESAANL